MRCLRFWSGQGVREEVMERIVERAAWHLEQRTRGKIQTEIIMFSKEYGILGMTKGAMDLLDQMKRERKGRKR